MVGTDPGKIQTVSIAILSGQGQKGAIPLLWDRDAAERVAGILLLRGTLSGQSI
jgi:hypothetical protein